MAQLANSRPLTKKEAAQYYSVSERTIDRWLLEGVLPPQAKLTIGGTIRFDPHVLETCLKPAVSECDNK
ncbi:hypothetical protein RE6C_04993 [Rhodopirellula europaea 6C]|uniref:Helix-turn-helix domain-containing protein n=1 Tax=Rhodopirellula europaea 6C TaxID=1263867 RepID=M2A4I4_9BACT|nr:hypothetical protein RE6C_04993 [Rhodopirellula europaea 6C]